MVRNGSIRIKCCGRVFDVEIMFLELNFFLLLDSYKYRRLHLTN